MSLRRIRCEINVHSARAGEVGGRLSEKDLMDAIGTALIVKLETRDFDIRLETTAFGKRKAKKPVRGTSTIRNAGTRA